MGPEEGLKGSGTSKARGVRQSHRSHWLRIGTLGEGSIWSFLCHLALPGGAISVTVAMVRHL